MKSAKRIVVTICWVLNDTGRIETWESDGKGFLPVHIERFNDTLEFLDETIKRGLTIGINYIIDNEGGVK